MPAPICTSTMPVGRAAPRGGFARIQAAVESLCAALIVRKERRALLRMDAFMLADIGLTKDEAAIEAARALWDVPGNWRRNV